MIFRFCTLLMVALSCFFANAQQIPNIYLHTDRAAYFPGDTIWFKGYLLQGIKLDSTVSNLYINWGGADTAVLEHNVYLCAAGAAIGQFVIPTEYAQNSLNLNAYTHHTAKQPQLWYFKNIPILQQQKRGEDRQPTIVGNSQSAFNNSTGIKVSTIGDSVLINISMPAKPEEMHRLELRLGYRKVLERSIDVSEPRSIKLLVGDLEAGLLQALLKDANGKFVASGAMLLGTDILITPQLAYPSLTKISKGKNSFKITLPDGEEADLSISITDLEVPVDSVNTIVPAALFGNLQKEKFDKPTSMFQNKTKLQSYVNNENWLSDFKVIDTLSYGRDKVLGLQGQILMKKDQLQKMNGELDRLRTKRKKTGAKTRGVSFGYRPLNDSTTKFIEVMADREGRLQLPEISFFDSLEVRVTQIEKMAMFFPFTMKYRFSPYAKVEKIVFPEHYHSTGYPFVDKKWTYSPKYYTNENGAVMLREINIKPKRRNFRLEKLDREFAKDRFKSSPTLFREDVQNDTNLVYIHTVSGYLNYLNMKYPEMLRYPGVVRAVNEELILPNQSMNVPLPETLNQILYVKFITNLKGLGAPVLAIYTKGPDGRNEDLGRVVNTQTIGGYVDIIPFKHRNYESYPVRLMSGFDDRQTLYWNPMLKATSVANEVVFYNNSIPKGFHVTIQGVTKSGKLVFYQKEVLQK